MKYGERIYELRKKIGLSQEKIANELNVTRQSVSLWETDQATPSIDNLVALSELFNISLDNFIKGNLDRNDLNSDENKFSIKYIENLKILYYVKYSSRIFFYGYFLILTTLFILQEVIYDSSSISDIFQRPITITFIIVVMFLVLSIPIITGFGINKRLKEKYEYNIDFENDRLLYYLIGTNEKVFHTIYYNQIKNVVDNKYYLLINTRFNTIFIPKNDLYMKIVNLLNKKGVKITLRSNHFSKVSLTQLICVLLSVLSVLSLFILSIFVETKSDFIIWLITSIIPFTAIIYGFYSKKIVSKGYALTTIVFGIIFSLFSFMCLIAEVLV